MSLVDDDIYDTLRNAVESPENYSGRRRRKQLKAAFDIACSQIASHIFGFEMQTRPMLRRKLNKTPDAEVPVEFRELVAALKDALAACGPLYSHEYDDPDEATKEFIGAELQVLVECLEELD